jgi:BlaI family penicillinase repressor
MLLSDAEWKVMKVLWEGHPGSTRDVLEGLSGDPGWAYTTVKTMLARLEEKGVVASEMRRNTTYYRPLLSQDKARKSALRSLVDRAFDGTFGSLIHHLVGEERLSPREQKALRDLIESEERKPPGKARR